MEEQMVKADVLCVGGGIAGLMAAIRASDLGARVIVAEKADTRYSGKGGAGTDHFLCYFPEYHGTDIDAYIEAIMEGQQVQLFRDMGMDKARTYLETTFDMMKLWDSWGIPMKYRGKYEFAGHAFPGRPLTHLKYEGRRQKVALTEQALKRGVEIVNRVMILDLVADGQALGAIGISTRTAEIMKFAAKSVILGTGGVTRLYPNPTPGWFCNRCHPTSETGDGRVMAYRAGAALANLEMPRFDSGPKYFARSGKGTWIGILRDPHGTPIGPFLSELDRRYSDMTVEVNSAAIADYTTPGRGPVYMDCRGMSDEDYEYMLHWLTHEGCSALVQHLKEEGIDLQRHLVEFVTYERGCSGKICADENGETSIKGLYAAGDEVGGGISYAAVFGWLAGEHAAGCVKDRELPDTEKLQIKAEKTRQLLLKVKGNQGGPDWKEVNIALQQIMRDYAGNLRSEALLEAGLSHLRRLKEKAQEQITAENPHELARCFEVFNLLGLGELVFIAANTRKESRGRHLRVDYPLTNPLLNKDLTIRKAGRNFVIEWRK